MSQKELQDYKNKLNKVIQEIDFNKINSLSDSINQSGMRKETYFFVAMVEVLEMRFMLQTI